MCNVSASSLVIARLRSFVDMGLLEFGDHAWLISFPRVPSGIASDSACLIAQENDYTRRLIVVDENTSRVCITLS
jgi:hypothetical protein